MEGLDSHEKAAKDRTARSATYAISTFLRFLVERGDLANIEQNRASLRSHLHRGEYKRRVVNPQIDDFVAWVKDRPLPDDAAARLEMLRAKALVLTLHCSGMRRAAATALRIDGH